MTKYMSWCVFQSLQHKSVRSLRWLACYTFNRRGPRLRLFHVPCRRASWGVEQTRPTTADITMLSCCSEKITLGNDKIHVMMCFFNLCSINQYDLCDDWHATRSIAEGRRVGGRPPRLRLFHVPCRRASWGVEQTRLSLLLSLISLHSTRCT